LFVICNAPVFHYENAMRLIITALLVAAALPLFAQDTTSAPTPTPRPGAAIPIWRCELPGGTYEVALRYIVSVSQHEYLVDGVARVTEVNVDTDGSMSVRFYYLEPVTPNSPIGLGQSAINKAQEIAENLAERTGQEEVWKKVVKNYPTTTHSHTIEYRLESKDQLDKLYKSASKAFREARPGVFRATGS
jgi:hypothetical protein